MLYNYTDKMTTYEPDPDVLRWGLHLIDVCGLSNAGSCGSFTRNDPDLRHIEYVREGYCEPECANVENDELIAHALHEELSRLAAEEASGVSNVSQDHLQASILAQEWLGPSKRHGTEHGFDQRAANDYSETRKEGPDDSSGKKNDDADEMWIHSSRWTTYEPDPDVLRWGLHLIDVCGLSNAGSCGSVTRYDTDISHIEYVREGYCEPECTNVENDELIAHALQEELSRLAAEEASGISNVSQDHLQASILAQDWLGPSKRHELGFDQRAAIDYSETRKEEPDDSSGKKNDDTDEMGIHSSRWTSGEKSLSGDEMSNSLDIADESALDGEVEKRLNQMVAVPHIPKINGEIPSVDEEISDHQRLLDRLQLYDLVENKVQGDGNCQFRALSDQLYRSPEYHKFVREQVVNQLKSQPEMYGGYVPMGYGDYLKKMSKNAEWGDHVTLQAAADTYGVKIFVLTSFKDTCYIEILPHTQKSERVIFVSFWAEVHYNSIYPEGELPVPEDKKKKKWWPF